MRKTKSESGLLDLSDLLFELNHYQQSPTCLIISNDGLSGLNRIDFPTSRKVDAVDPFG